MDIPTIKKDKQDRNSIAWVRLCEYIDQLIEDEGDLFSPSEAIGRELYSHIYTLPQSIGKLKHVKNIYLYGSNLTSLPPEIGDMESLENINIYTSYNLKWIPYEIYKCKHLQSSLVSTRALYGNFKTRLKFPDLTNNPVRYTEETVKCSICEKEMTYEETNQVWITLKIGTNDIPLLANLCSDKCIGVLPKPADGYIQYPHKGGTNEKLPNYMEMIDYIRKRRDKGKSL